MEFSIRTRTSRKVAFRYFRKWNDAVKAAGLQPCRVYKRIEEKTLLRDWGETVRKKGGLPSRSAYGLLGNHHPRTLEARFGTDPKGTTASRSFLLANQKQSTASRLRLHWG